VVVDSLSPDLEEPPRKIALNGLNSTYSSAAALRVLQGVGTISNGDKVILIIGSIWSGSDYHFLDVPLGAHVNGPVLLEGGRCDESATWIVLGSLDIAWNSVIGVPMVIALAGIIYVWNPRGSSNKEVFTWGNVFNASSESDLAGHISNNSFVKSIHDIVDFGSAVEVLFKSVDFFSKDDFFLAVDFYVSLQVIIF